MAKHIIAKEDWVTLDVETLTPAQKQAHTAYKDSYCVMKANREAFEQAMQEGVALGTRMVLGYNFGRLSAAFVPDEGKAKAKATTQSLAEFLAAQASGGHRT